MASVGYAESLLGELPQAVKKPLLNFVRSFLTQLRFGAPSADAAVATENMGGHFVPLTTHATTNGEVAVAHGLARVPRVLWPVLPLETVNATLPVLTVTRAADRTYLYVSSATTSAFVIVYVE